MRSLKTSVLLALVFILVGCTKTSTPTDSSSDVDITRQAQFHAARDAQRRTNLTSLVNGLYQYALDHNGQLPEPISTGSEPIDASTLTSFLVPLYLPTMPADSLNGTDESTKYTIYQSEDDRIHLTAQSEQNPDQPIAVVR